MRSSVIVDSIRGPTYWDPEGENESLTLLEKIELDTISMTIRSSTKKGKQGLQLIPEREDS